MADVNRTRTLLIRIVITLCFLAILVYQFWSSKTHLDEIVDIESEDMVVMEGTVVEPRIEEAAAEEKTVDIWLERTTQEATIIAEETFDVFMGEEKVGEIAMSGRGTYGVKPRVKVTRADAEVVFNGLWEEPFANYDDVAPAVARQFLGERP